jgi:ketol-acid reductoisomerase
MKIYYDKDADLQLIRGKKVAVIGTGVRVTPIPSI